MSLCCSTQQGGMAGHRTPTAGGAQLYDKHKGGSQAFITPSTYWKTILRWYTMVNRDVPFNHCQPKVFFQSPMYYKSNWRRQCRREKKKTWLGKMPGLHCSFWATVQVFVFLIWGWFAVGAESDGKYWILPPHLSTCLINPVSPCHSPSLLALPLVTFSLLRCCALISNVFFSPLFHSSLTLPREASISPSTPSSLPFLCSIEEVTTPPLLWSFPSPSCSNRTRIFYHASQIPLICDVYYFYTCSYRL